MLQVLELGVQLSVLLGNPVANLEELLTWTEAELLRVTSGDTDMQHTRAQVYPDLLICCGHLQKFNLEPKCHQRCDVIYIIMTKHR